MIGSFRVRMLIVILISALAGFLMQASSSSRAMVEPVINYIMEKDYDVQQVLSNLVANSKERSDTVPVMTNTVVQLPCHFISIDKSYGWYFNPQENKQQFYPGMSLKVKENTLVHPIMPGKVENITISGDERRILVKHSGGYFSLYGGLKEILVNEQETIELDSALGKTGENLYFELRNQDGPVDPQYIFK